MLDIIKKSLFTGLGLAYLTKEKIEELSKEIIAKGNLSEQEGKDFYNDLSLKSKEAKEKLEAQIKNVVHDSLEKMNLASRDDVQALEEKVKELADIIMKQQEK